MVDHRANLLTLIDDAEIYQDVKIAGNLVLKGVRNNCAERYEAIKRIISNGDSVLEIGSNLGYFALRLAKEYPESVITSVEGGKAYATAQKYIYEQEKCKNVILVQGTITLEWLRLVEKSCLVFDHILLLSVIHHFPSSDVVEMCNILGKLTPSLIVEFPNELEQNSCGEQTRAILSEDNLQAWFAKERDEEIASFAVHTDPGVERKCVHFYDASFKRHGFRPFAICPRDDDGRSRYYGLGIKADRRGQKTRYFEKQNGDFRITENPLTQFGVSLIDLSILGPILWPDSSTLIKQFRELPRPVSDQVPWNYLYGSKGIFKIDDDEAIPRPLDSIKIEKWLLSLSEKSWELKDYNSDWLFRLPKKKQPLKNRIYNFLPAPVTKLWRFIKTWRVVRSTSGKA